MSTEDAGASDFLREAEALLRTLAATHGLVMSRAALPPTQGRDGACLALHGQLGRNWVVLTVWGRAAWLALEQCHVWWYVDDEPVVPQGDGDSPYAKHVLEPKLIGVTPQFKRIVHGLAELEEAVGPYAEWIKDTPIDQILVDAMASAWPRGRDGACIPITPEGAAADVHDALAEEPPKDEEEPA